MHTRREGEHCQEAEGRLSGRHCCSRLYRTRGSAVTARPGRGRGPDQLTDTPDIRRQRSRGGGTLPNSRTRMHPRLRSIVLACVTLMLAAAAPQAQTATATRPAAVGQAPLKVTTPEAVLRPPDRRRLRAAELHEVHRVRAQAGRRVGSHDGAEHRQDRRGPRPADGDHHRAGELQEARSLQGDRAPARRRPRASATTRRARSRRKARR